MFKDNFSKQASLYAKYRPVYPAELFEYLSSQTPEHDLAWDCATGNGQCAVQLANYFKQVFASDASKEQIENSQPKSNVTYKIELAERSSLQNNSADLLIVAQALHWFPIKEFFLEANRVLKKNGVLAVISYVNPVVSAEVDAVVDQLHDKILQGFWRPENKMVFEHYKDIDFPFERIDVPPFTIEKYLSRPEFLGHLRTWSAAQRYIDEKGTNPLERIEKDLERHWNTSELKKVTWPLHLVVGRRLRA